MAKSSRPYRMRKRAEQVDQTRQRIIEAAVALHTTVGPASTTVSALADEAGVTRVTVYRHFPDDDELFTACTAHWMTRHPPPDPDPWRQISGLHNRACHALDELYGWYATNADDLLPILRDIEALPRSSQHGIRQGDQHRADALVDGIDVTDSARPRLRAAAAHVVRYWTWRSLAIDEELPHHDAVTLAVRFVTAATD